MTASVVAVRPRRIAWVEGPDAPALLHGLLTADIEALPVGGATRSLVLTTQGHVVAQMAVARDAEQSFTLLLDPPPAGDGTAVIAAHHVSEDALVLGPEDARVLVATDDLAPVLAGAGALQVPGAIPGTIEVLADDPGQLARDLGITVSPPGAIDALRIARGAAEVGVDTGDRTLVQEARLDDAVSFAKGCFLGQETVARLHYRGHANRRLARIALDGSVAAGTDVLVAADAEGGTGAGAGTRADAVAGTGPVGTVTSVAEVPGAGWMALGMVRHEVPDGTSVDVGGVAGRILPLG
ncbi:MAG: hypothetical protein FJW99_03365 [Actinobacteria bacterium]|nr:hypothetical protein [Actinomycetota bacterium]